MANVVYELMAVLGLDTSKFEEGLKGATSMTGGLGKGIASAAKAGAVAVGAATTAAVGFAKSSVDAGQAFDKSMSQVAATLGMTMEQMQTETGSTETSFGHFEGTLREFAQFMGTNTAFSATQAADALNYMALAGYDTQKSMNMLPNVLNLAAAGNMDLARASDMVTDAQTAFGISEERTSQMVDEMAKAASTGNTSVEQLGDAFLVVGGLAQELNGGLVTLADGTQEPVDGLQEMEIAMTAMANAGVKGSEAGTHMRNMLLKLSSPTSDGAKALEEMGVAIFDTEGNMRSLADIFGDLNGKLGEMTQEQKIQTISDLFNTRDLASAEALLNAVGQDWNKIGESILDAEGASNQMAQTQLDNLAGDVTLFKSALEGAQIAISDQLTPTLREFVQMATTGLSDITMAFQSGGLEGAMGSFGEFLSNLINSIITKLPDMINAGMALLQALGQGLMDNMDVIIDAAVQIVQVLISSFASALPSMLSGFTDLINSLADAMPGMLSMIIEQISNIAIALTSPDVLTGFLDAGLSMLRALVDGIIQSLPVLIEALPIIFDNIVQFIAQGAPMLIQAAIELVGAIVAQLPIIIAEIIAILPQLISSIVAGLLSLAGNLVEAGIQLFLGLVEGIPQAITEISNRLPEIIDGIVNGIVEGVPKIMDAGIELFSALLENMPAIIEALVKSLPKLIAAIVEAIVKLAPKMVEAGVKLMAGLVKGLLQGAVKAVKAITDVGKKIVNGAKKVFKIHSPSKLFEEFGEFIDEGLAIGITGNLGSIEDAVDAMKDAGSLDDYDFGDVSSVYDYSLPTGNALAEKISNATPIAQAETMTEQGGRDINIIMQVDETQFAKIVYRLYGNESQRVGVNLSRGGN